MPTLHSACAVLFASCLLAGADAKAQHFHQVQPTQHQHQVQSNQYQYTPSYHIDQHSHVIRDRHGHVIGTNQHSVIHPNSTYIVPNTNTHNTGSYYFSNGGYYYAPQPAASAGVHYAARPVSPVQIQRGSFSHVDDLAARLETLANDFCLDLHHNYAHNPGYAKTYGEAYQILDAAKYIHAAEHQQDRQAIASRLNGLDGLFHHVQDEVRGWSRHQHHQVGSLGLLSKMDLIESTLHHLMNDVGVNQAPVAGQQAPPPSGGIQLEQAPPPPVSSAPAIISSPPPLP